jgi:hypothetical protein
MFWNTLTGEQKKNTEDNILEHLKGAATFLQVSESTFYVATRLGVWWISDLNCIRFLAVRQKYVPLVSRRRFRGRMSRFFLRYCHEFRQEKLKKIAEVSRKNSRYSGFSHNRLSLQPLLWHCCSTVHSLLRVELVTLKTDHFETEDECGQRVCNFARCFLRFCF